MWGSQWGEALEGTGVTQPYHRLPGNILLLSEPQSADNLMLVDFEYSSYNYR